MPSTTSASTARCCASAWPTPGSRCWRPASIRSASPPARSPGPRYDAMQAYFDEWGPEGRRMMSSCASIQVNIDSGDEATLARRWDLAHRIGPAMAATFACSPGPLHRSERLATWNAMDPTRTKPVLASGRLTEDWTDYVLEARLMLVHERRRQLRAGGGADHLRRVDRPGHRRSLAHPRRPRLPLHHAVPAGATTRAGSRCAGSTASPPASPRSPPPRSSRCSIDEDAGEEALEACSGVDGRASWATTASLGTQDPALAAAGGWLLTGRGAGARAQPARRRCGPSRSREAAERWPAKGRSPADDLEERLAAGATVLDLADPPIEVWP